MSFKLQRIRRLKAHDVLACLQAPAVHVAPGAAEAAQAHGSWLRPCLRLLAEQLRACAHQLSAVLSTLAEDQGRDGPIGGGDGAVPAWRGAQDHRLALCRSRAALGRARLSGVTHAWRGSARDAAKWEAPPGGDAAWLEQTLASCPLSYGARGDATCSPLCQRIRGSTSQGPRHGQALRHLADRLRRILMAMLT